MARPGFVLAAGDLATIRESVSVMYLMALTIMKRAQQ